METAAWYRAKELRPVDSPCGAAPRVSTGPVHCLVGRVPCAGGSFLHTEVEAEMLVGLSLCDTGARASVALAACGDFPRVFGDVRSWRRIIRPRNQAMTVARWCGCNRGSVVVDFPDYCRVTSTGVG